jgi:endonuclease/exonuclease/phosphatase family metal-dependent hydrolase
MTLVRLVSYNIRYGGRGREDQIAEVLDACSPDLVLLQEAVSPDVVEKIARKLKFEHWGSRRDGSTGFLSRLKIARHEWYRPYGTRHPFLEVELAEPHCRFFALHLSAWFSKWSERRRATEIRGLLDGIQEHQDGLHVIAGDFNALAPGEVLRAERMPRWIQAMIWLSGRDIARDTIQHMLDAQYADGWRRLHPGADGCTFPTWDPHVRLDYIFMPERYSERILSCEVVKHPPAVATASDHFPLLAEIDCRAA